MCARRQTKEKQKKKNLLRGKGENQFFDREPNTTTTKSRGEAKKRQRNLFFYVLKK